MYIDFVKAVQESTQIKYTIKTQIDQFDTKTKFGKNLEKFSEPCKRPDSYA